MAAPASFAIITCLVLGLLLTQTGAAPPANITVGNDGLNFVINTLDGGALLVNGVNIAGEISNLKTLASSLTSSIDGLNQKIMAYETRIANLEAASAHKDLVISELQTRLSAAESVNTVQDMRLTMQSPMISSISQSVQTLNASLSALGTQVIVLSSSVSSMNSSLSSSISLLAVSVTSLNATLAMVSLTVLSHGDQISSLNSMLAATTAPMPSEIAKAYHDIVISNTDANYDSNNGFIAQETVLEGGFYCVSNGHLQLISMPNMKLIRRWIEVGANGLLIGFSANALTVVMDFVQIAQNPLLPVVSFSSLAVISAGFYLYGNTILTLAVMPLVTFVGGDVLICNNAPSFVFPINVPHASGVYGSNRCCLAFGSGSCTYTFTVCP